MILTIVAVYGAAVTTVSVWTLWVARQVAAEEERWRETRNKYLEASDRRLDEQALTLQALGEVMIDVGDLLATTQEPEPPEERQKKNLVAIDRWNKRRPRHVRALLKAVSVARQSMDKKGRDKPNDG